MLSIREIKVENNRIGSPIQLSVLDFSDNDDIARYEKSFFKSFYKKDISDLISIWDFDEKNRRAHTKIPYSDQEIYVAKIDTEIVSGMAVNYNMKNQLQLEMLGFKIDKTQMNIAEGLVMFNLVTFYENVSVAFKIRDFAQSRMNLRLVKKTYGTCPKKLVKGYLFLGWNVIDEKLVHGQLEYLLEKKSDILC
jgi:hypothetical protein